MVPYYELYFLVLCGVPIAWIEDRTSRRGLQMLYFFFLWIVLSIFAGSRAQYVDRDLHEYYQWYHSFAANQAGVADWLRDPAYGVISYMLSHLGLGFQAVVLSFAFLGVGVLMIVAVLAASERWSTLTFYLLFCQFYVIADMTEIRAAVAIPLMTLSVLAACRKRWWFSTLLLMLAVLFHFSAIVALPVWVLLTLGAQFRTRMYFVILIATSAIAYIELGPILNALSNLYRFSEYLNGGEEQNDLKVLSWYALLHLMPIVLAVLAGWRRLSLQDRVAAILSSIGMASFFLLSSNTGLATRLLYAFDLFWVMLWVYHLDKIEGERTYIYTFIVIALGLALYFKSLQYLSPYSLVEL